MSIRLLDEIEDRLFEWGGPLYGIDKETKSLVRNILEEYRDREGYHD